jgi:flagellar FliL protein
MADDNEENENEDVQAGKSGGGKKKLILLIVAGLLVIAGAVGGTLFMLGFFESDGEEDTAESEMTEEAAIDKPSAAIYFPIKPAFVVNFQSRGRQRYLQTEVILMTRDPSMFTALQTHLPLIKNRLVMLLGGQVYEELQTNEGKELLRQQALDAVNDIMMQEVGSANIEQALFSDFVMQ